MNLKSILDWRRKNLAKLRKIITLRFFFSFQGEKALLLFSPFPFILFNIARWHKFSHSSMTVLHLFSGTCSKFERSRTVRGLWWVARLYFTLCIVSLTKTLVLQDNQFWRYLFFLYSIWQTGVVHAKVDKLKHFTFFKNIIFWILPSLPQTMCYNYCGFRYSN